MNLRGNCLKSAVQLIRISAFWLISSDGILLNGKFRRSRRWLDPSAAVLSHGGTCMGVGSRSVLRPAFHQISGNRLKYFIEALACQPFGLLE